ncbi:leucine-rich repeat receptor-like protein kinase family protein [Striga asiatica]|uniref:Leucine-rich repeat receptor-like protein kinase family protein n=1 Tax=Striga asiatica TaxID=4170 RepID=A0A5A7P2G9_STRAF|nr:leucine-rich repeat receptor-like protein kinase family protein [Striga asiatica]
MDDSFHLWFFLFLLPFLKIFLVSGQQWDSLMIAQSDYNALNALKHELIDSRGVLRSWNRTTINPCLGWAGIKCVKARVIAIQLPWRGLSGQISEKIGQLRALRRLSLHDNLLSGPVPESLGSLPNLRGIHLFNNRLSGSIPPSIAANCLLLQTLDLSNNRLTGFIPPNLTNSTRLYRLNLSSNELSGSIPVSLAPPHSLTFLALQRNNLSGRIPDELGTLFRRLTWIDLSRNNLMGEIPASLVALSNLSSFNVSYNNLSGPVPSFLANKFNSTSFVGNIQLCGYTGSKLCPDNNSSSSSSQTGLKHITLSTRDIILIAAGSLLIVLLIFCCVLLCFLIRKKAASKAATKGKTGTSAPVMEEMAAAAGPSLDNGGKLVHFDGDFIFTADDLLCATAETMGKSVYGTTYKATLEDGDNTVAVKRLREKITKPQKEFESQVSLLGKIRHPNILALRAYYLGPKGEKLLVYDYMANGSLASFLHARGPETSIPWPTRKAIAVGIARGLSFLHTEHNMVHGNLTSSNILLDQHKCPKIAEVGLSRLVTSANLIATAGATGYRAPELSKPRNSSAKSDVFSLGVILLELLTGKSPGETGDGPNLPQWASSAMKEEESSASRVFDAELSRDVADGDELLGALRLALNCVDPSPAVRPEARQVLQGLEELRPKEEVAIRPVSGDV